MHFASYYRWLVHSYLFEQDGFSGMHSAHSKSTNILDIGCRDALILQKLAVGTKVGLDNSAAFFPDNRRQLHLLVADATKLPFKAGVFQYVLLSEVIEHIHDDRQTLMLATRMLAPGGTLWISTPAIHYTVGPGFITRTFERAWGHVRKGYDPKSLEQMLGENLDITTIIWPETSIRVMQLPNWLLSKLSMPLARFTATICFRLDRREFLKGKHMDSLSGHIYISARKRMDQ